MKIQVGLCNWSLEDDTFLVLVLGFLVLSKSKLKECKGWRGRKNG